MTGRPSRVAKPEGTLNYSYGQLGSLSRVYDSSGGIVDFRYYYNDAGRLERVVTPHGQTRYSYGKWGSLESRKLPNGVVTEYFHDNLLRTDKTTHWKDESKTNKLAEFDYL